MKWKCAFAHEPKCILYLIYFVFAADDGGAAASAAAVTAVNGPQMHLKRIHDRVRTTHRDFETRRTTTAQSSTHSHILSLFHSIKNRIMLNRSFMVGICSHLLFLCLPRHLVVSRHIFQMHTFTHVCDPDLSLSLSPVHHIVHIILHSSLFYFRCCCRFLFLRDHSTTSLREHTFLHICCFLPAILPPFFLFVRMSIVRHVFTMIK